MVKKAKSVINKREKNFIPKATLIRLPFYLRALYVFEDEGYDVISSDQIARAIGTNSAQTRKDFSFLGEFGRRGVGYKVTYLIRHLEKFLGVTRKRRVVLVGVGRLGSALLNTEGLRKRGFEIIAAFDVDPEKIGRIEGGVPVYDFRKFGEIIGNGKIDIAILTVPAKEAQKVVDVIVSHGVKSILNFVPMPLRVPKDVIYRTVCIAAEMQLLSYYLKNKNSIVKKKKRKV